METALEFVPEGRVVFQRSENLKAITSVVDVASLGKDTLQGFQEQTGLKNFRAEIVFSPSHGDKVETRSMEDRIREASRVIVVEGGWMSNQASLHRLSRDVLKADPKAIIVMAGHAGQEECGFLDPMSIKKDADKSTLEYRNRVTKLGLTMLGLGDKQLLDLNPNLIRVAHSRAAASLLLNREVLENPQIKCVFLAPVLGHNGFKPETANVLLSSATKIANFVDLSMPAFKVLVKPVSDFLINMYAGVDDKYALGSYKNNFSRTNALVLSKFIQNLMTVPFPDLNGIIDSSRHLFMVFRNDAFVSANGMLAEIKRGIGDEQFRKSVFVDNGSHHKFLKEDSMANKVLINFLTK